MAVLHTVLCSDRSISYRIRRFKRAKSMRLRVVDDGVCQIHVPYGVTIDTIEQFIIHNVKWIVNRIDNNKIKLSNPRTGEFMQYKKQAYQRAEERLHYFNQFYNFTYTKITIRNQKSRWGSCSRRGTLSFNYKIVLLPPELADYIIVHELCHLGQFNHSPKFWNLVAQTIPDYAQRRKMLKQAVD